MYYYLCDWCGKSISAGQETYVKAAIEIVNTSIGARGRPKTTTEPARFFHVNPIRSRNEWDRLGIEVKDESLGDCCYTRALKAIEGQPDWETPDMGMEWRLVPIGATIQEKAHRAVGQPEPLVVSPDAGLSELLATFTPSPRNALARALGNAGISTLEQLEAMSDDELMATPRIGWTTRTRIRAFIAARNEARSKQPRERETA